MCAQAYHLIGSLFVLGLLIYKMGVRRDSIGLFEVILEGTAHLRVRTLVTATPQSGVGTAGDQPHQQEAGKKPLSGVQTPDRLMMVAPVT